MNSNYLFLSTFIVIAFLFYSFPNSSLVQNANAQLNMDSFSAKGIIDIPITHTPLLNDVSGNNSELITGQLTPSKNRMEANTNNTLPVLKGQWGFEVHKGEVKFFRVIFTLVQNDRIVNAFAIFNLTDTKYIQLNDKGTEIITGTVDFTSVGVKNGTLYNVPATISIISLSQLRIALDETVTKPYFTDPIIGATRLLTDANGDIIIGPRPQPKPPQSSSSYDYMIFSPIIKNY